MFVIYTVEPILAAMHLNKGDHAPLCFSHFLWIPNDIHNMFSMQCCLHSAATCLYNVYCGQANCTRMALGYNSVLPTYYTR